MFHLSVCSLLGPLVPTLDWQFLGSGVTLLAAALTIIELSLCVLRVHVSC